MGLEETPGLVLDYFLVQRLNSESAHACRTIPQQVQMLVKPFCVTSYCLGNFKGEQNWVKLVRENFLRNHHESLAEGDQTLAKWKGEHFLGLYLLSFVLLEKYFKI